MSFFGGFIIGGASGFAEASRQYATANVGRTYLSKSDAVVSIIESMQEDMKTGFCF